MNPANLSSVQSFARARTYKGKTLFLKNMTLKFKENIFISQRNIKESIQSFPCPVVCASSNIQRSLVPIPTPLQILISQIRKQISESTQSFHPPTIQPNQPNKQTKMKNCGKKSSLNTLTRRIQNWVNPFFVTSLGSQPSVHFLKTCQWLKRFSSNANAISSFYSPTIETVNSSDMKIKILFPFK